MTSEPESPTERFVEETGARYAYAFDRSKDLTQGLHVLGLPTAVLVDPAGKVVWVGHPASLSKEDVVPHLEGSFAQPLWEWPSATKAVRKELERRRYGKALEALAKLEGKGKVEVEPFRSAIEGIVARRMELLEEVYAAGDFLGASRFAETVEDEMDGLDPHEERAEEIRKAIRSDEDARRVLKLQEEILEVLGETVRTKRDVQEQIEALEELREEGAGTYAAKQAEEHIQRLREMLG